MMRGCIVTFFMWLLMVPYFAALASGAGALYGFGPENSRIWFEADAVFHDFQGVAKKFQGLIELKDPDNLASASVKVEIDPAGIDTGISLRNDIMWDNHLEVKEYPSIVLMIDQVQKAGPDGTGEAVRLTGDAELLIHGVKREIKLTLEVIKEKDLLRASGHFMIRMSDFQITRPSFFFIRVRDNVKVFYDIAAKKQESP